MRDWAMWETHMPARIRISRSYWYGEQAGIQARTFKIEGSESTEMIAHVQSQKMGPARGAPRSSSGPAGAAVPGAVAVREVTQSQGRPALGALPSPSEAAGADESEVLVVPVLEPVARKRKHVRQTSSPVSTDPHTPQDVPVSQ